MEKLMSQQQPRTYLQQIGDIKNWNFQQQLKLSSDNIGTTNTKVQSVGNKNDKAQTNEKSTVIQQVFDDIPVKVSSPNFKDLVENIQSSNETVKPNVNVKGPHRFLRKGEGIARFRMGPQKIPKTKEKNNRVLCLSNSDNNTKENPNHYTSDIEYLSRQNCQSVINKENVTPLEPPCVKLGLKNKRQIFESEKVEKMIEQAIIDNNLDFFQPDSSFNSSTSSYYEKLVAVARNLKDKQELQAFESMEQHVLDSSFCSSSSFVTKIMKDAIISTPTKESIKAKNKAELESGIHLNTLPTGFLDLKTKEPVVEECSKQFKDDLPIWTDARTVQNPENQENLEESLHVRFNDCVDYKSFNECSQSLNISNQKGNEGWKEDEEWREDNGDGSVCSDSCECSTTYSSSDEDGGTISLPGSPLVFSQTTVADNSIQNCPTGRLEIADLEIKEPQDKENTATLGDGTLKNKMQELDEEIKTYKTINEKLESDQESLEKERKLLQQQKKKFLKEIDEEKKAIAIELEEGRNKLAKEKLVFEKHSKMLTKNPNKEGRKEIQALREQLSELKEEMNKKESRWGAAQARLRNQVKLLEENDKKLRQELEALRKQTKYQAFLTQNRKGKQPNNTKLIHAINQYISNNPLEDTDPSIHPIIGSYFSSKEYAVKPVLVEVDSTNLGKARVINEKEQESKPRKSCDSLEQVYHNAVVGGKTAEVTQLPTKKEQTQISKEPAGKTMTTNDPFKTQHLQFDKDISANSQFDQNSNVPREILLENGTTEKLFPDGRKEIKYKNGNIKKIDPISGIEKTIYFNGDVKEIKPDGTEIYYFFESKVWQTTLPDGLELKEFPDGTKVKRLLNGTVEKIHPNGNKQIKYPDNVEEVYYINGNKLRIEADKTRIIYFQNGQKEIRTDEYVKRVFPDGTTKTIHPDGVAITEYSNGVVRVKDKDGNLVMDSGAYANRS